MLQIKNHISDISVLCTTHGVKHLYAFGSVLTDQFNTDSDVDLLVNFLPISVTEYADNYYHLKFSLEAILNRRVDLLEEKALKHPFFIKAIENQKQLLYGA